MANPRVFDELSSRLNKNKRPDSGIHNSLELSGGDDKNRETLKETSSNVKMPRDGENDSGRDSDPADNSSKKSAGVLKNFKKLFKRGKSKTKSKGDKLNQSQENLNTQYKAQSEPDILTRSEQPKPPPQQMHRYKSEVAKPTTVDITKPDLVTDEDEEQKKKNSIKDAQQYIRSSLRKLKIKHKKTDENDSPKTVAKTSKVTAEKQREDEKGDNEADSSELFVVKTSTKEVEPANDSPRVAASIKLADVSLPSNTPKIEISAAKDKIRIAPRDRRKPSRFRSPPPTTSHSLTKIDEDTSQPPSNRSSAYKSNSKISLQSDDGDRSSFSVVSTSKRNIGGAQRSKSTNSRENVNVPPKSINKPRSAGNSVNDLNNFSDIRSIEQASLSREEKRKSSGDSYGFSLTLQQGVKTNEARRTSSITSDGDRGKRQSAGAYSSLENCRTDKSSENIRNSLERLEHTHKGSRESLKVLQKSNRGSFKSSGEEVSEDLSQKDSFRKSQEKIIAKANSFEKSNENIASRMYKKDSPKQTREANRVYDSDSNERKAEYVSNKPYENDSFKKSHEDITSRLSKANSFKKCEDDVLCSTDENVSFEKSHESTRFTASKNNSFKRSHENVSEAVFDKETSDRHAKYETSWASSDHSSEPVSSNWRNSYGERTFALTSPRRDLELPPDFPSLGNVKGRQDVNTNIDNQNKIEFTDQEGQIETQRPQTVKIRSDEVVDKKDKKEVAHSTVKTHNDVKDLGKPIKPPTKQKPVPSPRKDRKIIVSPKEERSVEKVLEFSRISLKRVPKTSDFVEEGQGSVTVSTVPSPNASEKGPINSIVPLKKLDSPQSTEQKEFSTARETSHGSREDFFPERNQFYNRTSLKKLGSFDETGKITPRKSVSPTEDNGSPEFKRVPLKTVPKRNDFNLEGQTTEEIIQDSEKKTSFERARQRSASAGRDSPKPPPKPKNNGKPFSFQSNDVMNRSKSLSSAEARRLRDQTACANEANVPSWMKTAKAKQHDVEDVEVDVNVNVKPSAIKPKPNSSASIDPTFPVASPPTQSKSLKLPTPPVGAVPSRATKSFNATTDVSKEQCIVCGKIAYVFERCVVNKQTLHKNCAKCDICSRKLNIGGIYLHEGKVYCSNHK